MSEKVPNIRISIGKYNFVYFFNANPQFVDRGGTFCDALVQIKGKEDIVFKLLSEDPPNYPDAPTEAIRRALEIAEGITIPVGEKLDGSRIGSWNILNLNAGCG